MSNEDKKNMSTSDAIKYNKDCRDFICLSEGTLFGDHRYCNLSLQCRQVDVVGTDTIPMESHYCPIVNPKTQEIIEWQYYCTGKHDNRSLEERKDSDEKVL